VVSDDGTVAFTGKLGRGKARLLEHSEEMKVSLSKARFVGR
jgi:hypothetical protein